MVTLSKKQAVSGFMGTTILVAAALVFPRVTGKILQLSDFLLNFSLDFGTGAILMSGLMMGALVVAHRRYEKVLELKDMLHRHQELEIEFQHKALNAHSIISFTDEKGCILEVNDKFVETFGYPRDELIGESHRIIHVSEGNESTFDVISRSLGARRPWQGEHVAKTRAGERLIMRTTIMPLHDEEGLHIKNVNIRTDVTELRKTESSRALSAILDKLQDEIYIYDVENLNIVYVNEKSMERCGWTRQDLSGKRILDTAKGFKERLFRAHVEPLVKGEKDVVSISTEHEKGPVEIITRICHWLDDLPVFVSVLRDITERKKLEAIKMETVSMVSHELRTPLTSIKGALRLLQSGVAGDLSKDVASIIDIASRNSDRLLLVVNDILDLEKIQAGKMDFSLSSVDLSSFLSEAVDCNKGYGDQHRVTFEIAGPQRPAWIKGNPDRLMQVMSNLFSNAAKFSPEGEAVVIELSETDKSYRVSVTDKGPGISEDAQKTIFDSFTQAAPSDGLKRNGTGLGLTITKKIIEHHSGRIDLISSVGKGTTFYFDLPKLH